MNQPPPTPPAARSGLRRFRDLEPTRWANGLGWTTELLPWSPIPHPDRGSEPPVGWWRLSIARLTGPTPFSPLPGVSRWFAPVGGAVTLRINGVDHLVDDRGVAEFAGNDEVATVALQRPTVSAVNLMSRGETRPLRLVLGSSDRLVREGALAVVALRGRNRVEQFDLVSPGAPALGDPLDVAVVLTSGAPAGG